MLLSPTFPDPLSSLGNLIFPVTVDHLAVAKTMHGTNHLQLSDINNMLAWLLVKGSLVHQVWVQLGLTSSCKWGLGPFHLGPAATQVMLSLWKNRNEWPETHPHKHILSFCWHCVTNIPLAKITHKAILKFQRLQNTLSSWDYCNVYREGENQD